MDCQLINSQHTHIALCISEASWFQSWFVSFYILVIEYRWSHKTIYHHTGHWKIFTVPDILLTKETKNHNEKTLTIYYRSSIYCLNCKGELHSVTASSRRMCSCKRTEPSCCQFCWLASSIYWYSPCVSPSVTCSLIHLGVPAVWLERGVVVSFRKAVMVFGLVEFPPPQSWRRAAWKLMKSTIPSWSSAYLHGFMFWLFLGSEGSVVERCCSLSSTPSALNVMKASD